MVFKIGEVGFKIDLGAEQIIAAEKGESKIAVEIKSFVGKSAQFDFYEALGQFNSYIVGLEEYDPERVLYLAVPKGIYSTFFQKPGIQLIVKRNNLRFIVYNHQSKAIEEWIK
ncbi:MAG: element excision factor XisH family protein [Saprospiraceae bacterium]